MSLRQGIGRLIRDEKDRGLVMICDRGCTAKATAGAFSPACRRCRWRDEAAAAEWLDSLEEVRA